MKRLIFLFLVCLAACNSPKENRVNQLATDYFKIYADRTDWDGFQALYADDLIFEDVVFRYEFDKEGFVNFYNWPDSLFKKHPDFPHTLVLQNLTVNDSTAIGSGYFTPFYYGGRLLSNDHHWRFTMELTFDKQGKIKRHKDFIEYDPEFMKSAAEALINTNH